MWRSAGVLAGAVAAGSGAFVAGGCTGAAPASPATGPDGTTAAADGSATGLTEGSDLPLVQMNTSAGNLVLQLHVDVAPKTVDNFVGYAEAGFYDGADGLGATIFHRVRPGFVVQGGGLTAQMDAKPTGEPIPSEAMGAGALPNRRGTVAMALIPGDPNSATSQFFINVTDNPELDADPAFTVFATVALGMEAVDAMSAVDTTTVEPYEDVPVTPIVVESVDVL